MLNKVFIFLNTVTRILKIKESDSVNSSDLRYKRIFKTGFSIAFVRIFSAVINLFTVPLTIDYLGAERYGLWMTISTMLSMLSFADLGLGNGLLNAIAKAKGRNSMKDAQIAVSSTFFILLFISVLLLSVILIVYPNVEWYKVFNVKTEIAKSETGPSLLVFFLIFLINLPLGIIGRIQDGHQEGYKYQVWLIIGSIISLIMLLICIELKGGLPWLVLALSSGQVVASISNGIFLFSQEKRELLPRFVFFDFNTGRSLINEGSKFLILSVFTILANSSDALILSHTLGLGSVSGFEIVKKIFLFSMFTQFIIQPLWPAFAEAIERGDYSWANKTLKKAINLGVLSGLIISLPLLLFGKQIVVFWVGKMYEPSFILLLGFYANIAIANYGGVMSTFLNSGPLLTKQTKMIVLASICSIILKIVLSIKFGSSGIIWATVIGYSLFYVTPSYNLAINYLKNKI